MQKIYYYQPYLWSNHHLTLHCLFSKSIKAFYKAKELQARGGVNEFKILIY